MSITKEYQLIQPTHHSELCISSNLGYTESYIIHHAAKNLVVSVSNTLLTQEYIAQLDSPHITDRPTFKYGPSNATTDEISDSIAMTNDQWLTFIQHLQHDALDAADYIATLITQNDADPNQPRYTTLADHLATRPADSQHRIAVEAERLARAITQNDADPR